MADAALQLLIDVRAKLDELNQAQVAIRDLGREATSTGQALKAGLGIEIARRGIDLLTRSVRDSVMESMRMASAIQDASENLGVSTEAYQVLAKTVRDAGGDVGLLTQAISNNNRSLAEARNVSSAAASAYRSLGIDIIALERAPVQKRFELIARAIAESTDKTAAFDAASKILGSRNLPTLMGALRKLATEGYDGVAEAAKKAGAVMENDTIRRLKDAQQALDEFNRRKTIVQGEAVGTGLRAFDTEGLMGTLRVFSGYWQPFYHRAIKARYAAPQEEEPGPAGDPDAAARKIAQRKALADAEHDLRLAILVRQLAEEDDTTPDSKKRETVLELLREEIKLRDKLGMLLDGTPIDEEEGETQEQRDLRVAKLGADQVSAQRRETSLTGNPLADKAVATSDRFHRHLEIANRGDTPGVGLSARLGAMDWITNLGTQGEQTAAALQSSLGATVQGISDGIHGWITGTQSFGDAMLQLGDTVFRTMLDTIVQMGVQWLVTQAVIKSGMMTTEGLADALRSARVAKENAAEAATLPAKTAGAAASGISSFGAALLFGVMAVAMIAALSGGFADGGYTTPGPKSRPAGIVHAGEWVAPQWLVNHPEAGPVIAGLEAMREGAPGYKFGGWVFDFKKHVRYKPEHFAPKNLFLTQGQKEVNAWVKGKPRDQQTGWGSDDFPEGGMQLDALNVPSVGNAAPVSNSAPALSETDAARSFASRESGRNVHVYLDRSAWLESVTNDLRGIAREVYAEEMRKA